MAADRLCPEGNTTLSAAPNIDTAIARVYAANRHLPGLRTETARAGRPDRQESQVPRLRPEIRRRGRRGTERRSRSACQPRHGNYVPLRRLVARRRDEDDDDAPKSRRGRDEEEDEDYPTSKRRRKRDDEDGGSPEPTKADIRQGWERVRFGINLIILAVWIGVGAIVAVASGVLVLGLFGAMSFASIASSFGTGGPPTQQNATNAAGQAAGTGAAMLVGGCVVGGLIALLALAQVVSRITGLGFCMGIASTRKTQALKGLAIAAFSLAIANVVLPMLSSGELRTRSQRWGMHRFCRRRPIWPTGSGRGRLFSPVPARRGGRHEEGGAGEKHRVLHDRLADLLCDAIRSPVHLRLWRSGDDHAARGRGGRQHSPGPGGRAGGHRRRGQHGGPGAAVLIGGITSPASKVLIGLALFIWYVVLLYQVRYAVDRWIDRN